MGENAALIAALYGRGLEWNEATLDHWYENAWHPEVDHRAIEGAPDDVGVMEGRDRLRRYYEEWLELFEEMRIELVDLTEVGDRVVAALHVSARSRTSGIETTLHLGVVYEFRDGLIARGREHATYEEAVAAARRR